MDNNNKIEMTIEKQLKTIENNVLLYNENYKQAEERYRTARNKTTGERLYSDEMLKEKLAELDEYRDMQFEKYQALGGDVNYLRQKMGDGRTQKRNNVNSYDFSSVSNEMNDIIMAAYDEYQERDNNIREEINKKDDVKEVLDYMPENGIENSDTFDVISLPSNGECYKSKKDKIAVGYLTAYDENMLVAPNLYRDNLFIDYLLKAKVLDKQIDTDELLEGDRDAILLFLRSTGYGNEYPIVAKDDVTGENFDTVVDLSKLKYKDFKLKGDENGWFDYELPVSKKKIKFRFLTHKDWKLLDKIDYAENNYVKKDRILDIIDVLTSYVESDKEMDSVTKIAVNKSIEGLEKWSNSIEDNTTMKFTHAVTNKLEMQIMSVDGNMDRGYIRDFVRKMNVRDSSSLRKYIEDNQPGIDYNIEYEKPERLGGGVVKGFLRLDQFLFLNISI